ncbi:class I SAM-dependent methyltransferase [Nocardia sp. NPDC050712]|uniref:class I SAM-dependent methyltransferase n=1 Tax=Nocardia sp. NPDC050712 TaxID=3155518 RepID=UPI0033BFDF7B
MRSDDDSWDITSSVGLTALGVAVMRANETRRADALFSDPFAEVLVRAVGQPLWTRLGSGEPGPEEQALADAYAPIAAGLVARTSYFDDYFAAAVAAGIRQFVIVAAGLDARAYRLEWPAGSVLFELDLPAVLEFKAAALAGYEPRVVRREVAADLRQDWPKALLDTGFDPESPTAWLAEGLLRYLPGDAQDRLFDDIVALSAPGSRFALNTVLEESERDHERNRERADLGAPLGLGVDLDQLFYSADERSNPIERFRREDWDTRYTHPSDVLAAHGRELTEAADLDKHILMTAIRPGGDSTR